MTTLFVQQLKALLSTEGDIHMYAIIEWWSAFSQAHKLVIHPLATVDTYNTDIISVWPDLSSAMQELKKLKAERGE